ncbi:hypothetical protein ACKGJY_00355 [Hyunsoonleella sp. 2307UL5-6]|uniref:hypothetical protein n=1 Tax=Hyunsoonleella sp. 2307UL5-6 TaxID=3384768 RepID=UPI0039BC858F
MNKILTISLFLIVTLNCYSTEQISDLLIVENDTLYLKSFPLEKLDFEKSPFSYGEFNFPHTGCWRGYCATWKIIDNKLALLEVVKVDSTKQKLDLVDFFKQNNYSPKFVKGYVYADWFDSKLLIYSSPDYCRYAELYLEEEYEWTKNKDNLQLVFEKGILKENNIVEFDSYKIGDNLSFDFSHFPLGLIKKKSLKLKATITEVGNDMVSVKIYSYDTKKRKEIEQIRKFFENMVDTDTILTNPRYWKKQE